MGRRSTTSARAAFAVLMVLAACAQLSSALHYVLVAHVHCAEHGALVHGHGEARHAAPTLAAHDEQLRAAPEAHDGHEHCTAAAQSRADLGAAHGAECLSLAPPVVSGAPLASVADALAPIDRAPKTSPPA